MQMHRQLKTMAVKYMLWAFFSNFTNFYWIVFKLQWQKKLDFHYEYDDLIGADVVEHSVKSEEGEVAKKTDNQCTNEMWSWNMPNKNSIIIIE